MNVWISCCCVLLLGGGFLLTRIADDCLLTPMPEYRLSDGFLNISSAIEAANYVYPNSILAKYTREGGGIEKLIDIALSVKASSCVIHVRVGDVLERNERRGGPLSKVLETGSDYSFPLSFYRRVSSYLVALNITHITIMAGAHQNYRRGSPNSKRYIQEVASVFHDFSVSLRLGQSPDEDFIFVITSSCFVAGKGGYASLLKQSAILNNVSIVY